MNHGRAKARNAVRIGFAIFFVVAGINHFVMPEWYLANQMPPWVPAPLLVLYFTGIAEVAGGAGLLVRALRQQAMWGLLLLLAAIFPGNLHMFSVSFAREGWSSDTITLLLRLPLQAVFMYAVWWSSRPRPE